MTLTYEAAAALRDRIAKGEATLEDAAAAIAAIRKSWTAAQPAEKPKADPKPKVQKEADVDFF